MIDKYTYRIFLTKTKEMCFVHSIHFGTRKVIVSSKWGNHSVPIKGNILMEDTGIRDINNKRIYEGDIVKFSTELFGSPKQIIWDECRYRLKNTFIILCDMKVKQFGLEVIGNIYENFTLLEGENNVE